MYLPWGVLRKSTVPSDQILSWHVGIGLLECSTTKLWSPSMKASYQLCQKRREGFWDHHNWKVRTFLALQARSYIKYSWLGCTHFGVTWLSIRSRYSCLGSVLPNLAFLVLPELVKGRDNRSAALFLRPEMWLILKSKGSRGARNRHTIGDKLTSIRCECLRLNLPSKTVPYLAEWAVSRLTPSEVVVKVWTTVWSWSKRCLRMWVICSPQKNHNTGFVTA